MCETHKHSGSKQNAVLPMAPAPQNPLHELSAPVIDRRAAKAELKLPGSSTPPAPAANKPSVPAPTVSPAQTRQTPPPQPAKPAQAVAPKTAPAPQPQPQAKVSTPPSPARPPQSNKVVTPPATPQQAQRPQILRPTFTPPLPAQIKGPTVIRGPVASSTPQVKKSPVETALDILARAAKEEPAYNASRDRRKDWQCRVLIELHPPLFGTPITFAEVKGELKALVVDQTKSKLKELFGERLFDIKRPNFLR